MYTDNKTGNIFDTFLTKPMKIVPFYSFKSVKYERVNCSRVERKIDVNHFE